MFDEFHYQCSHTDSTLIKMYDETTMYDYVYPHVPNSLKVTNHLPESVLPTEANYEPCDYA